MADTDGPLQGNNTFAYCFNNPVNMDDYTGQWPEWLKNAVKFVVSNVISPIIQTVKNATSEIDSAFTAKQNLSLQMGNLSAGIAIGSSVHFNGDVMIHFSSSGNISLPGGVGVSSQTCVGVDYVSNLDQITGSGVHMSGTATMPIPYTPISGDGAITNNIYPQPDNSRVYGVSIDAGAAFPQCEGLGLGAVIGFDNTIPLYTFNIYDQLEKLCAKIMEW